MAAGVWTHRDIVDDAFTLTDLFDIHEMLDVRAENDRRTNEYIEAQRETKQHGY